MTTSLSVGNSEGTRRCDETCHGAQAGTSCVCVCGGRYHGRGTDRARELIADDLRDGRFGGGVRVAVEHLYQQETLL